MQTGLRVACNVYAAMAGFPSVEDILARREAGAVRLPTRHDRHRKPRNHPLFFAAKRGD